MMEISEQDLEQLAKIARTLQQWVETKNPKEIELSPEVAKRVTERVKAGKCLQDQRPLENESRVSRGLCETCYARTMQRISRGAVVESELVREGWILPRGKKGGRKAESDDPVADMIAGGLSPEEGYEKHTGKRSPKQKKA